MYSLVLHIALLTSAAFAEEAFAEEATCTDENEVLTDQQGLIIQRNTCTKMESEEQCDESCNEEAERICKDLGSFSTKFCSDEEAASSKCCCRITCEDDSGFDRLKEELRDKEGIMTSQVCTQSTNETVEEDSQELCQKTDAAIAEKYCKEALMGTYDCVRALLCEWTSNETSLCAVCLIHECIMSGLSERFVVPEEYAEKNRDLVETRRQNVTVTAVDVLEVECRERKMEELEKESKCKDLCDSIASEKCEEKLMKKTKSDYDEVCKLTDSKCICCCTPHCVAKEE